MRATDRRLSVVSVTSCARRRLIRDREEVCPIILPSEQAAAGSGLLSELQLSLRTECACAPPPNKPSPTTPGTGRPRTRPSPHKPLLPIPILYDSRHPPSPMPKHHGKSLPILLVQIFWPADNFIRSISVSCKAPRPVAPPRLQIDFPQIQ